MINRRRGNAAARRRPRQERDLEQEGLDHFLQRLGFFVQCRGQRLDAHGAATIHGRNGAKQIPIQPVQAAIPRARAPPSRPATTEIDAISAAEGERRIGAL